MKELQCASCGTAILLTDEMYQRRQDDGQTFYCPNGHAQVFSKPRVTTLEETIDWYRRRLSDESKENKYLRHAVNGYKGQLARLQNKYQALVERYNALVDSKVQ